MDLAVRSVPEPERRRLIPGDSPSDADIVKLWGPLERATVPPGFYRYTCHEYLQPREDQLLAFEVFSLVPEAAPAEPLTMIGRRIYRGRELVSSFLEGSEVLERSSWPPATLEQCATRLYAQRPAVLADGSPAPFGRELAILEWSKPEQGAAEGPQGRKARLFIAARWGLARAGSTAELAPRADFGDGSHRERIALPLAGAHTITEQKLLWNRPALVSESHALEAMSLKALSYKTDQDYAEAIQLMYAGETARALDHVDKALGRFPDTKELLRVRAGLLAQEERWGEAAQAYDTLALHEDVDVSILNNLAFVEIHRGEMPSARKAAERALELDPKHLTAHVNAGIAAELSGDRDGARKAFERGLAVHPGAPSLVDGLRRVGGGS